MFCSVLFFSGICQLTNIPYLSCAQMYPSIQAKIWGNIGQVADLLDMVLDSFIKRSVTGGLGSIQAEIMADTAVALTSANVQLVSRKVIGRLCRVRLL